MDAPSSSLARSRSRYKGSRSGKFSTSESGVQQPSAPRQALQQSPSNAFGDPQSQQPANVQKELRESQEDPVPQPRPNDHPTQSNAEALARLSGQKVPETNIKRLATRRKAGAHRSGQNDLLWSPSSSNKEQHGDAGFVHAKPAHGRKLAKEGRHDAPTSTPPSNVEEPRSNQNREPGGLTRSKPKHSAAKNHQHRTGHTGASELSHPLTFDAPISAVNAGERTVAIEYRKSVVAVAVTPNTTPMDLIEETTTQLRIDIDPTKVIVVENFSKLGLERRLRPYERIRNVLNAWDRDSQNNLYIRDDQAADGERDLKALNVPQELTADLSVRMYYSQRPRQWEKQTLILRPDGQVLSEKKGSVANVCHMSDFDIYVPTKHQQSKKIKPPKKLCVAIKSQQKSNMFLSTENFVHFFSTSDKQIAAQWHSAISGWRSWYLVHVMGEGEKTDAREQNAVKGSRSDDVLGGNAVSQTPLYKTSSQMEMQRRKSSRSKPVEYSQDSASAVPNPKHLFRQEQAVAASPKIPHESTGLSEPFKSSGLLGRTYTKKKMAQAQRDTAPAASSLEQSSREPMRQKITPIPGARAAPLVDLTPKFQEAPQHRTGRGISLNYKPVGGLVDVATSPENAVDIPPSSTWRRPTQPDNPIRRADTVRTTTHKHRHGHPLASPDTAVADGSPFSKGLLSSKRAAQGSSGRGRGVQTGHRNAEEPMLDMRTGAQYAPGSLLASVEAHQGDQTRPNIEREAREEFKVKVGESS